MEAKAGMHSISPLAMVSTCTKLGIGRLTGLEGVSRGCDVLQ